MNRLTLEFESCYGIRSLSDSFDFTDTHNRNPAAKAYAIYAPNGSMKSSFAKTFDRLAQGQSPSEDRHQRVSAWKVEADGVPLPAETIYVLKAELDLKSEIPAVTDLLVRPDQKERYDALVVNLEKKRKKAVSSLNRISGLSQKKIEDELPRIYQSDHLLDAIRAGLEQEPDSTVRPFHYGTIFDDKALQIIQSTAFREKASEFNERYEELFQAENTLYRKGEFNPARAEIAFGTLKKERFFTTGHRVQLRGEDTAIDEAELQSRMDALHARIDGDQTLQKLRKDLASTAQSRALTDLIEDLDIHQFEYLIEQTRRENLQAFQQRLWTFYLHETPDAAAYSTEHADIADEIEEIERDAAQSVPAWEAAVNRFNTRFINMPFKLRIANQSEASLGKEPAQLRFVFEEAGHPPIEKERSEDKTLSQGERRVMHLLSFIFEAEARKQSGKETLFVCDDPADSFDYKNKHAIVQYLEDLTRVNHFHLIILTHNFDLLRTLTKFVHRKRCLAALRDPNGHIQLKQMDGISNIFVKKWKSEINSSNATLLATIPFTRNLIEYSKGDDSEEYKLLTSLLHWKSDSLSITVGQYFGIYNQHFGARHDATSTREVYDLLIAEANSLSQITTHDELKLENKIVMSIATRVTAEKFITEQLRTLLSDPDYWCEESSQFGALLGAYKLHDPAAEITELFDSVSVTVSSNIHLNSFMYEPILDLSTDHLCHLYNAVKNL